MAGIVGRNSWAVAVGLIIVTQMGGCTTGGGGREKLREMPADVAWQTLEDSASTGAMVSPVVGFFTGTDLAQQYADIQKREVEQSKQAANSATTPREALEAMVSDVSTYLKQALPADARARNLDQYRLNIAMGDLLNRDNDPALEGALGLITRNLERDQAFNDQFGFVAFDQSDADAILNQLATNAPSLFDPTGKSGGGQSASYRPDTLYLVSGRSWVERNDAEHEVTIWTEIEASHVQSRRRVGGETFVRSYIYHPGYSEFITETRNEELRASWNARKAK